ncbi:MAG: DUF1028 domain-containing protein [Trueperaceae bacterium]|nr:MAG: DUF1028 domain-containing protein [Trueperaceae bacterium]
MNLHTFSIAGRSADGKSFGVAVSTARPNVGSLVPFVGLQGAVATQARVNTELGRKGLALLEAGVGVKMALSSLLEEDPDKHIRQLHGVDTGEAFAFTGENCVDWAGHQLGSDCSVAGNMLAGPQVISAMAKAFEGSVELELSERLLRALEAGQAAGGDKRGKQSAALLVASPSPRLYHNLRVDDHGEPIRELCRIYRVVVDQSEQIRREYGEKGLELFSKIKI